VIYDLANIATVDVLSGIQYHSSCSVSLSLPLILLQTLVFAVLGFFLATKLLLSRKCDRSTSLQHLTGTVAVTDWNDNFTRCLRHPSRGMELIYDRILTSHQMLRGSSRPTTTELLSLCIHIFFGCNVWPPRCRCDASICVFL